MESKVILETLHNVHIKACKVELTMRRKNAPVVKARIVSYPVWGHHTNELVSYARLYGDSNAIWEEIKNLEKQKIKINKWCITRVCAACSGEHSFSLSKHGCLYETKNFLALEDPERKLKYIYLFCSEECKNLFELNPLAYEKEKGEDASIHV